ncbi:hypothetical protein NDU88_003750 [Pleurodeles waltl]|uniref:Uncharacterized protein n=1 Tax=Pleurodeles waltl TaxID=8319 RepID=A0AAV7NJ38_PLEWA|nr:hypothetical protein NDU88_003750 [Pleurodeles waltl]
MGRCNSTSRRAGPRGSWQRDQPAEQGTWGGAGANEAYTTQSRPMSGEGKPGLGGLHWRFDPGGPGKGLTTGRTKGCGRWQRFACAAVRWRTVAWVHQ